MDERHQPRKLAESPPSHTLRLDRVHPELQSYYSELVQATETLDRASVAFLTEQNGAFHAQESNAHLKEEANALIDRITRVKIMRDPLLREQASFDLSSALSLSQIMQTLRTVDEKRVLVIRGSRPLGLRADFVLRDFFLNTVKCGVEQVLPVFTRIKGVFDNHRGLIKPANSLYVVLASPADTETVFRGLGSSHSVEVLDRWTNKTYNVSFERFSNAMRTKEKNADKSL